jgi:uncharacterized protein YcnI
MDLSTRARRALGAFATAVLAAGAFAAQAGAHAKIGPSLITKDSSNAFTLMVPTEGSADTVSVTMDIPEGFNIGSFEAIPGVKRSTVQKGSGDEAVVSQVTWTGLKVPEGEGAFLRFSGYITGAAKDYVFKVRQTYSDGKVVDWAGPADSEEPAPVVSVKDSFAGDSGTDTLTVVALILAALALLLGLVGLGRRGGRSLT